LKLKPEKIEFYDFDKIPNELIKSVDEILNNYKEAQKRISFKNSAIKSSEKIGEKISSVKKSKMTSSSISKDKINQSQMIKKDDLLFYQDIRNLDEELNNITNSKYKELIVYFDNFANILESEAYSIIKSKKAHLTQENILKHLKLTKLMIIGILNDDLSKNEKLDLLSKYHDDLSFRQVSFFNNLFGSSIDFVLESLNILVEKIRIILNQE
jgi:hypothetical protein